MKTKLFILMALSLCLLACSDDKDEPNTDKGNQPSVSETKSFVSENDFNKIIVGTYWINTREGGRYTADGEQPFIDVVGLNDIGAFLIEGSKFRRFGNGNYREFLDYDIKGYDSETGILYTEGDRHSPIHFESITDGKVRITYDHNMGVPRYDEAYGLSWEEGSYVLGIFRPATAGEIENLNKYDPI